MWRKLSVLRDMVAPLSVNSILITGYRCGVVICPGVYIALAVSQRMTCPRDVSAAMRLSLSEAASAV